MFWRGYETVRAVTSLQVYFSQKMTKVSPKLAAVEMKDLKDISDTTWTGLVLPGGYGG